VLETIKFTFLEMPSPVTFFDHQDLAKTRSHWALLGFGLTVVLTCAAVSLFGGVTGILLVDSDLGMNVTDVYWFSARVSAVLCLSIIFISWAYRAASLSAGPEAVMKSMGAWKVPPDSQEPDQRQLLNLVEEMSIASGVPMPDVYMMDDTAINACAVGMEIDQAAIAVTRGAVVRLTRNELQGVIAHEYSHILHGDMALNTHMIAWLAGLFTLSELGRMCMAMFEDESDSWFSGIRNSRGQCIFIIVGGGIWLLGSIGVFFGKLLQAGLSRQREFLADASAIQYTRHPEGLGNALRKLGKGGVRGRMRRPPSDCGHMMFANLRSSVYAGAFSTHPPLEDRIIRILPAWDGSYLKTMELEVVRHEGYVQPLVKKTTPEQMIRKLPSTLMLLNLLEDHRMPETALLSSVETWKTALDPIILNATRNREGAQNLIFAMVLQPDKEQGLRVLKNLESRERVLQVEDLLDQAQIEEKDRLGLLDLTLPALRMLDEGRKKAFMQVVKALSEADGQIDLFEYSLQKILEQGLEPPSKIPSYQRMRLHISKLESEINVMLSALSRLGSDTQTEAAHCFAQAEARMFGFTAGIKLKLLPASECGLDALDNACEKLPALYPNFQQRLLLAGLAAIAADDYLHFDEVQAFRAFAAVMRIPVPPGLGLL
jgi:Zn-dependent protease with chaperone function